MVKLVSASQDVILSVSPGTIYFFLAVSCITAALLIVYNALQTKKSHAYFVIPTVSLVISFMCLYSVSEERLVFPMPILHTDAEIFFIAIYSLPSISAINSMILMIIRFVMLFVAAAHPVMLMFRFVSLTFLRVFFIITVSLTALILFYYGYLISKGKEQLHKVLCLQFGIVLGTFDILYIITLMVNEKSTSGADFMVYVAFIMHMIIPASCLMFLREIKELDTDSDTLI